tara:strand:+ start:568 stop:771 length:204 start_codon:yes stop_codon:yes gene_type:complete
VLLEQVAAEDLEILEDVYQQFQEEAELQLLVILTQQEMEQQILAAVLEQLDHKASQEALQIVLAEVV